LSSTCGTGSSWSSSGALLVDTPGLRLVTPLEDHDEAVPHVEDKERERRERRERQREVHRALHREQRSAKRARRHWERLDD